MTYVYGVQKNSKGVRSMVCGRPMGDGSVEVVDHDPHLAGREIADNADEVSPPQVRGVTPYLLNLLESLLHAHCVFDRANRRFRIEAEDTISVISQSPDPDPVDQVEFRGRVTSEGGSFLEKFRTKGRDGHAHHPLGTESMPFFVVPHLQRKFSLENLPESWDLIQ